ncbi:hypothetical protein LX77_01472 [Gelidibacter algens]|uniref:Uncharacterized protein n=1 Tax=Gelidibacter algens TaxID=49280 RepID=A0A327S8B4_9FLAO|nr:hypothetical protein [Gelidibacter algens]RAJ25171.1 hypothetical protein LX77_01472 [Gelidibacter algens]
MAEIKIEKKRPVWPWVVLILIVLAIIVYFIYENRDNDDYNDDLNDGTTTEQMDDSIDLQSDSTYDPNQNYSSTFDEFSAFEESISDSTRIAVDSSYTKKAFSNLAKAVVAKADESALQNSEALNYLRDYSTLSANMSSTTQGMEASKNFKTPSEEIVTVLGAIQSKKYPALQSQVSDLKQIAAKVDGSKRMDGQQAFMNSFLNKAKDVLQAMNN